MNPTDTLVTVIILILLIWEVWTLMNSRKADTISETVWRAMLSRPLIPFLFGALVSHFIWIPNECWELFK